MGLLLRMAWRNILRNRRRTILTASMIALGLGSLILTDAYIVDMTRNMVGTATDNFFGQAQVHVKGFRVEDKVEQTVRDLPRVEALLREDPSVSAFSERVSTASMVSSASDAESVILYGIDPAAERKISRLAAAVRAGNPLADADGNGVLLGDRLAKTLQVGVGDRVVVTCTQAVSGELSQEMFRVRGIFSFDTPEMDRGMAFVGLTQAQKMMSLGGMVHEIAIRFKTGTSLEASHLRPLSKSLPGGQRGPRLEPPPARPEIGHRLDPVSPPPSWRPFWRPWPLWPSSTPSSCRSTSGCSSSGSCGPWEPVPRNWPSSYCLRRGAWGA